MNSVHSAGKPNFALTHCLAYRLDEAMEICVCSGKSVVEVVAKGEISPGIF